MSKENYQQQKQMEKREQDVQRDTQSSSKPQNSLLLEQQLLLKSCSTPNETTISSENEEVTGQEQANSLESSDNSTPFSLFGSRIDDEDPIFTLDEEVQAKELFGERTRHYTADFDPTASDEDEVGNLNRDRAYSASNRFPPRVRHSGRLGNLPNTGILHKLHGKHVSVTGQMVPASLPIQISRGFIWPPRDLVDNLSEEEDVGGVDMVVYAKENVNERGRAKTMQTEIDNVTNEEQNHDSERNDAIYGRIRAYSRSIQPDDDPERVFGERPHRRYSSSLKYDLDLDENSTDIINHSGGENIPPITFINQISSSIPNSGRASVGGTADTSSTATTPRVVMPTVS